MPTSLNQLSEDISTLVMGKCKLHTYIKRVATIVLVERWEGKTASPPRVNSAPPLAGKRVQTAMEMSTPFWGGVKEPWSNVRRECVCSASREICCAVNFSRLGGESASRGFTGAR